MGRFPLFPLAMHDHSSSATPPHDNTRRNNFGTTRTAIRSFSSASVLDAFASTPTVVAATAANVATPSAAGQKRKARP
jgi:hypothetical protein